MFQEPLKAKYTFEFRNCFIFCIYFYAQRIIRNWNMQSKTHFVCEMCLSEAVFEYFSLFITFTVMILALVHL